MTIGKKTWFNPFHPKFREDPYPSYHRLRAEEPVHWDPMGYWYLTRYADVVAVLRDNRFSVDYRNWEKHEARFRGRETGTRSPLVESHSRWLLFSDPPDHTRVRKAFASAFSADAAESMRGRIEAIVDRLLLDVEDPCATDVIRDLAYPLPIMVISHLLGVPDEDRDVIKPWCADLIPSLSPFMPAEHVERASDAVVSFYAYLRDLLASRRAAPRDDLLSVVVAAWDGGAISEDEALALCVSLYLAGHETTIQLIGNGVLTLLRNPDQLEALRSDPSLVRRAVEEMLRYESPVQITCRTALEDVEVAGQPVRKGEMVTLSLGAANRDPERFPDPDRFDVARHPNPHLGFGVGIHHCLGASLARVEAQVAIRTLVARYGRWTLKTESPEWLPTLLIRGLRSLPVAFEA
jgi:pimeloyl-[acyl-carrier protein] synthase